MTAGNESDQKYTCAKKVEILAKHAEWTTVTLTRGIERDCALFSRDGLWPSRHSSSKREPERQMLSGHVDIES